MNKIKLCSFILVLTLCSVSAVDFRKEVWPIFENKCLKCHGPEKQKGGFRVDRLGYLLKGGDSGEPAIISNDAIKSHLVNLITSNDEDKIMPPKGKPLSDKQIQLIKKWIDTGNIWPGDDGTIPKEKITHWSFQPIKRPAVPKVLTALDNPVDAFLEKKLLAKGLTPSEQDEKLNQLRRLYLVATGLAPTAEEMDTFINDKQENSWEKAVDRVLASPRFGERWAQHWLDIVRFGETDGFETNRERPDAYHYRDYVIKSFNDDKPYDRFIKEQIAGDYYGVHEATGFLVAGPYDIVKSPDKSLTLKQRQDELTDIVNTTGTSMLGLTLGCAMCHNHKFDPVTQKEFFQVQAVFAGVHHGKTEIKENKSLFDQQTELTEKLKKKRSEISTSSKINEEVFAPVMAKYIKFSILETNDNQHPCIDEIEIFSKEDDKNLALAKGVKVSASGTLQGYEIHQLKHLNDGLLGNRNSWISNTTGKGWIIIELETPAVINHIRWSRDRTGKYNDRTANNYRIEVSVSKNNWQEIVSTSSKNTNAVPEVKSLENKLKQLNEKLKSVNRYVYSGNFRKPKPTYRLFRGDPMEPREEVQPGGVGVLGKLFIEKSLNEQQRRVKFAEWVVDPENPLTARVMVNRLWQHVFGRAIVATPNDFGLNGIGPTHPELLDWLADEFKKSGWSNKHILKLIFTSQAFRRSSFKEESSYSLDSSNLLLWRFSPRRLDAEPIRDRILQVSGSLDYKMGGPGFSAFKIARENVRHYFPLDNYGPNEFRRMIYMTKVRQEKDSVFGAFDCPDASQVISKRSRSTTPLQALNLFNSSFVIQQSEILAAKIKKEFPNNTEAGISAVFHKFFARKPTTKELTLAKKLVQDNGYPSLCRALYNSNEFLFIF